MHLRLSRGNLFEVDVEGLFPIMEAVRSGGDLRNLGGFERYTMEFDCPDGIVRFRIEAHTITKRG